MKLTVEVPVKASREAIWKAVTDIENAAENISGINEVVVHHKPDEGVVGLKWTETRTLFGREAKETMWITEAQENRYYRTRAESHGAVYTSTISIEERDGQNLLKMEFGSKPQTLGAKIMSAIMMPLFKGATKKALLKDLEDIKSRLEESGS